MSQVVNAKIDIKENELLKTDKGLLSVLLQDKTTGKNILWATDNYKKYGDAYSADKEIKIELITGINGGIIKPRIQKSKEEQQQRVRDKAEVFTPSWICKKMNDLVDSDREKMDWHEYVSRTVLEITCGEAPFLTSRYDTTTGETIAVKDRIGLLDRKLCVVGENTETCEDWLEQTAVALQSTYGYEWQGDNLLIARENMLFNVIEYFAEKFGEPIPHAWLERFAEIISWNLWQMDGLKFVVPNSCCTKESVEEDLFERRIISKPCEGCRIGHGAKSYFKHNGVYCTIKDWKNGAVERFVDSLNMDDSK